MTSGWRINGGWMRKVRALAPCMAFLLTAGCDFDAIGDAGPAGLGCWKDLFPSQLAINLTPPMGGLIVGGTTPAPTNSEFLEKDHAFAVEWYYTYEGYFTPGPAKHAYTTRVEIYRVVNAALNTLELVWETEIDSDPVDVNDEGWDIVTVPNGLPTGPYELHVELDPYDDVPECDDISSVVNNTAILTFVVYGSSGPPQDPTPCQESEDPDCDDDVGPRGR